MEAQQSTQQPLPPGTKLDIYDVRGVLGTGGFGVTYEAIDPELDRRVAIEECFPESLAARGADGTTLSVRSGGDSDSYD
jgi:hypothetical protein